MADRLTITGQSLRLSGCAAPLQNREGGLLGTRLKDPSARDLRHCLSLCPGLDTAGKNVSWLIEADA
jgi:hypothetical protein